jgi:dihydrofolate synthase/folylpolyglutamate synthase
MQRLKSGPLVDLAPPGSDVWLDGGHNPAAGVVIAQAFAEIEDRDPRPLILVCGMLTTKDPAGFFRPFAGLARHAMTVPVPGSEAGYDPETLAMLAMEVEVPAYAFPDIGAALNSLREGYGPGDPPRILICGSLYLAGSVLEQNGPLPE